MMFPFFSPSVFSKKKTSHLFHHLHQSLWCDIKWFTHPNPRTLQPQQWLAKITMAASMPIVCVSKAAIFSVKSYSRNFHDIIILFSFFPKKVPQLLMRNLKKLTKERIPKAPESVIAELRPWKEWFNYKMEDIYEKIRQIERLDWTNLQICRQEFLTNRLLVITTKNDTVIAKWKWSISMMKLKNVFCLAKRLLYEINYW